MSINILQNNTLQRKSNYEFFWNKEQYTVEEGRQKKEKEEFEKNIKRTIQIDSSDRTISIFPNPYNIIVYVNLNNVNDINNEIIKPRINKTLPYITSINLTKIIIPLYNTIIKTIINITDATYVEIATYLITQIIANNMKLDVSFYYEIITITKGIIITIVNYIRTTTYIKINFIIDYNKNIIHSIIFNIGYTIQAIATYQLDKTNNNKTQRTFNLIIKELNNNQDYNTSNIITTFRIFPTSIKNNYLYANTKDIIKMYDKQPLNLNKLSIILADNNNIELKINYLDTDIQNPSKKCLCTPNNKLYSCACTYILHPYYRYYQLYLNLNFTYNHMVYPANR